MKTFEEKANTLFGYKRYVERAYAKTKEEREKINDECYLLAVMAGDEDLALMLAPCGTKLICVKVPKDGKYGYNDAQYTELKVGEAYTVVNSSLSEASNSKLIEGCGENRYDSCWFKIANPITKDEALRLYGNNFEEDFIKAEKYLAEQEEKSKKEFINRVGNFRPWDLESGDVVVYQSGSVGVVLKDAGYIVMQNGGYDYLEDIEENFYTLDGEDRIEKVFRGQPTFSAYDEGEIVYLRLETEGK